MPSLKYLEGLCKPILPPEKPCIFPPINRRNNNDAPIDPFFIQKPEDTNLIKAEGEGDQTEKLAEKSLMLDLQEEKGKNIFPPINHRNYNETPIDPFFVQKPEDTNLIRGEEEGDHNERLIEKTFIPDLAEKIDKDPSVKDDNYEKAATLIRGEESPNEELTEKNPTPDLEEKKEKRTLLRSDTYRKVVTLASTRSKSEELEGSDADSNVESDDSELEYSDGCPVENNNADFDAIIGEDQFLEHLEV